MYVSALKDSVRRLAPADRISWVNSAAMARPHRRPRLVQTICRLGIFSQCCSMTAAAFMQRVRIDMLRVKKISAPSRQSTTYSST